MEFITVCPLVNPRMHFCITNPNVVQLLDERGRCA